MLYKYFFAIVISFWSTSIAGALGSEPASNSISNSSNATIPASIVSLASDASVSISTASADTTSASGAFASAEAALNSALSVATAAAASYVSVLPIGAPDPTGSPGEQNSGTTRRVTASMMGVGVVLIVALVL